LIRIISFRKLKLAELFNQTVLSATVKEIKTIFFEQRVAVEM